MARLRRFFSEAPVFFIAVVVGIAITFRVAIGWAKAPSSDEAAKDPTLAPRTPIPVVTAEASPAATATTAVTTATATVAPLPRKKPRPRR